MRRAPVLLLVFVLAACGGEPVTDTAAPTPTPEPKAVSCTGSGVKTVKAGALTVASDIAYAPFESVNQQTQQPEGFDIDLLTEIAKRANLKAEFVNQGFDGIIAGLIAKKYDVIASAMTITDARKAQICFSDSYFDINQSLMVNAKRTPGLTSTDGLAGKVVGVQKDTTGEAWANEHLKGKAREIKSYDTLTDALLELQSGKVDGVVNDRPVNLYYAKAQYPDFKVVQEMTTDEHYGIAVHPENKGLLDAINTALKAIRDDGTYDKLFTTWFGAVK